jgi:hypothetical protein
MTVTKDEFGLMNQFATEPEVYTDPEIQKQMENGTYENHNVRAERLNGRLCMVGFAIGAISYLTTGTLGFGLF